MRRLIAILAAATCAAAVLASPSLGASASFRSASADGSIAIFSTTEQLVPGDTDARQDVYERSFDAGVGDYVTREASTGPVGGNDAYEAFFEKASTNGETVFFSTVERLVASDTDGRSDVYARDLASGTTELVSVGAGDCLPACGQGDGEVAFAGATPEGDLAFFVSTESLDPKDTDSSVDVYEHDVVAHTTTLVSDGAAACAPGCGHAEVDAFFLGSSADGSHAYFGSAEQLATEDTDSASDIFARALDAGTTTLVSIGSGACLPGCGNGGAVPVFQSASNDGTRIFFTTDEKLGGDTDAANDVYTRDLPVGPTTLVSAGTSEDAPANFAARSADGSVAFLTTAEGLAAGDENDATDVYRWAGGIPQLVTSGSCAQAIGCGAVFNAATSDGALLLFSTTERLSDADIDDSADVYAAKAPGWTPAIVSAGTAACAPTCGNSPSQTIFSALSGEGSTVLMTTAEQLSPTDSDSGADIYARDLASATTTLVTHAGVCPLAGACNAIFSGVSADGAHVFFQTEERLTVEDVDSESDVYERSAGETRIVSIGNSVPIGPTTPVLTGTSPVSPGQSMTPGVHGQADLKTSIKIYSAPGCVGSPIVTGTSLELGEAGIQVSVVEGTTTTFYATATDLDGDTSACSAGLAYTQATAEQPPPPPPPPPPPGEEAPGTGGSNGGTGKSAGTGSKGADRGGNQVAWVAPQTLITYGPGNKTRKRRPVFRFNDASEQAGTDFFCKLDRRGWKACASPRKLPHLTPGKHVFRVKARNAVGTWGERPAKRSFKVIR